MEAPHDIAKPSKRPRRRKSPFSDEVADEWERLLHLEQWPGPPDLPRQPAPELVKGTKDFFAKTYQNGEWLVSAADAGLVVSIGADTAFREYRYDDAAHLVEKFLEHPEARNDFHFLRMTADLGLYQALSGRVEEGLRVFETILGQNLRGAWSHIRSSLVILIYELNPDTPPDPRVMGFVSRFLLEVMIQKRRAKSAKIATTNRELMQALDPEEARRL